MTRTAREVIAETFGKLVSKSDLIDPLRTTGPDWILQSLDAAGFVIVPKEPTTAIVKAGLYDAEECDLSGVTVAKLVKAYRRMIAAAETQS